MIPFAFETGTTNVGLEKPRRKYTKKIPPTWEHVLDLSNHPDTTTAAATQTRSYVPPTPVSPFETGVPQNSLSTPVRVRYRAPVTPSFYNPTIAGGYRTAHSDTQPPFDIPIDTARIPEPAQLGQYCDGSNIGIGTSQGSLLFSLETAQASEEGHFPTPYAPSTYSLLSPLSLDEHATNLPPNPLYLHDYPSPTLDEDVDVPRMRGPRIPQSQALPNALREALTALKNAKITPTDFLLCLLDETDATYADYRTTFYAENNTEKLGNLMTTIWTRHKGNRIRDSCLLPLAVDLVCDTIHREMDNAKPYLRMSIKDVTPEFVENWNIHEIMGPVSQDVTPTWSAILDAATETKTAKGKTKLRNSRNRGTGRHMLSAQAHYLRSFSSCKVQVGIGMMAWATGASRSLINVLHHSCLSMSSASIIAAVESLAEGSIQEARIAAAGPHGHNYDNINISTSIHVEQAPGAMSKVQSGTLSVIYPLPDVNPEHLLLAPMMEQFKNSSPLKMSDLRPSNTALESYTFQSAITIAGVLFKYVGGFSDYASRPGLQHRPVRRQPTGRKAKYYPLRCVTIEEASTQGNIHVQEDAYRVQLNREVEDLCTYAIPTANDGLTNSRIRAIQSSRLMDLTVWDRRSMYMIAIGLLHMLMNLIWALKQKHKATINQSGSLTHLFAVLEKVRLGGEHPDFHALLSALTQILDGFLLNAWREECGYDSFEKFAQAKPSDDEILRIARVIFLKYATPDSSLQPIDKKTKIDELRAKGCNARAPPRKSTSISIEDVSDEDSNTDVVQATADGDFGRIEHILPDLACLFRGAGCNNYSTEILHLLFQIKEVWTPEFA
ncbi:hypothetical protein BD779DRAFT_1719284 [Infundibulicybe gibba]|nr:hypothetical protein BD779DRAFT_1719284 [Infundibulicybe gibba]